MWGGWSSITVKAFVFCKMLWGFFFLLFVNSLLFVWREISTFSKQTFSFEVNTELFVLSIGKYSIEFCGVFKLQSVLSYNVVSAESSGLLGKEK